MDFVLRHLCPPRSLCSPGADPRASRMRAENHYLQRMPGRAVPPGRQQGGAEKVLGLEGTDLTSDSRSAPYWLCDLEHNHQPRSASVFTSWVLMEGLRGSKGCDRAQHSASHAVEGLSIRDRTIHQTWLPCPQLPRPFSLQGSSLRGSASETQLLPGKMSILCQGLNR